MSKRAYESAALTGFEVTVPAPAAPEQAATPASGTSGGTYEDSWYRTLRVMSGAPSDDVERAGALDAPGAAPEASPAPALPESPAVVSSRPLAVVPPPATSPAPSADQPPGDSYEDSWYQILKSRRAVGDAD